MKLMLSLFKIEWSDYLLYCAVAVIVYEAVIILRFQRKKNGRPPVKDKGHKIVFPHKGDSTDPANPTDLQAPGFADELKALSKQAKAENFEQDDLLFVLKRLVNKYPGLKKDALRDNAGKLISLTIQKNCGIQLSESEVDDLWM